MHGRSSRSQKVGVGVMTDEEKKQSVINHTYRLALAIKTGAGTFQQKTYWCQEHQQWEY